MQVDVFDERDMGILGNERISLLSGAQADTLSDRRGEGECASGEVEVEMGDEEKGWGWG